MAAMPFPALPEEAINGSGATGAATGADSVFVLPLFTMRGCFAAGSSDVTVSAASPVSLELVDGAFEVFFSAAVWDFEFSATASECVAGGSEISAAGLGWAGWLAAGATCEGVAGFSTGVCCTDATV